LDTEVIIVGAGPVGLTLAIDLGRRGVRCILLEQKDAPQFLPKMERCNARTMEIYRRLGIAQKVREAGYPRDAPMDVFIVTSLIEPPLLHLPYPSVAQAQAEIVTKQCEEIVRALEKLKGFKDLAPHWIEVHRLENDGDRVVRQAMADLFTNGDDAMTVIKWKDVYALLEKAIDSAEDAANVIERIVVKHA